MKLPPVLNSSFGNILRVLQIMSVLWCFSTSAAPIKLIFDTDMDTDCDDAGAAAMLYAMADKGEVEVLATMVSSKYKWSVPAMDVINTYYNRPDMPIGSPKGKAAPTNRGSKFAEQLVKEFPHDLLTTKDAPDALKLYRKILAKQPDSSVIILTVGYLTNLHDLLNSKADQYSSLNGMELVKKKVKRCIIMGGKYPADTQTKVWGNFRPHPEAIINVAANWPTLITFTGGGDFAWAAATGIRLTETPKNNPVRRAYELFFKGTIQSRHSADPIAVYVAVRGVEPYLKLATKGYNHIFENATHEWRTSPNDPRHQHVSALAKGIKSVEVIKAMEDLMVQPPMDQE